MSDRSATMITIGGTIKTMAALKEIIEIILADGLQPGWNEFFESDDGDDCLEVLLGASKNGKAASLFKAETPGGQFEDFEAALREHGLSYHRRDDGHYAYAASHEVWHPHMREPDGRPAPFACDGSIETGPAIALSTLMQMLGDGAGVEFADELCRINKLFDIPPLVIDQAVLDELAKEEAGS